MRKMPLVYNDPVHWRARAVEARALADRMQDDDGRDGMLVIAEQYELIAERAGERLRAKAAGRAPILPD
jgi:hypothetical protein